MCDSTLETRDETDAYFSGSTFLKLAAKMSIKSKETLIKTVLRLTPQVIMDTS